MRAAQRHAGSCSSHGHGHAVLAPSGATLPHVGPIPGSCKFGIGIMMPIFIATGSWHCAGSETMVLALALSAFCSILILHSWTAWCPQAFAPAGWETKESKSTGKSTRACLCPPSYPFLSGECCWRRRERHLGRFVRPHVVDRRCGRAHVLPQQLHAREPVRVQVRCSRARGGGRGGIMLHAIMMECSYILCAWMRGQCRPAAWALACISK